ncbi:hypothetical protein AO398_00570 [Methylobacterium sp. GXS13]|jgi:hypothetical protein|uniref:hypothetical protein n=1 Tax=Methylobacterium sp. GXS13 TaxID=1730094 RepID=UPI00071B1DB3|nr:hypothetical protein [Methylobacterium sp. GXS13]KST61217.1 hypothetical protein AO398_00570 [Methylobacterium sp. GXS13]
MPSHACVDPQDQYAQAEVLVAFETTDRGVRLVSAHDASDDDILPGLEDFQRQALESEILDDYRHTFEPRRAGTSDPCS